MPGSDHPGDDFEEAPCRQPQSGERFVQDAQSPSTQVRYDLGCRLSSPCSMSSAAASADPILWTADNMQSHLDGQIENGGIEWVTLAKAAKQAGCGDGRCTRKVAGTFGSTVGRLFLQASSLERVDGTPLERSDVRRMVRGWAEILGVLHLHTDRGNGIRALGEYLRRNPTELMALLENPGDQTDMLMDGLLRCDCMGCGDLKNKMSATSSYPGLRAELAYYILAEVHALHLEGSGLVRYEILDDVHRQGGILLVDGDATGEDDVIPLLTPSWRGRQTFVVHRPLERYLDATFALHARSLTDRTVSQADLLAAMNDRGTQFMMATANAVLVNGRPAAELPIMNGTFSAANRSIKVESA